MKIIDKETWGRKKTYEWFSAFSNPTYGVTARVDITKLIEFKNKTGRKFYADFLFLVTKALNSSPAFRQREEDLGIVEYDSPDPSITVAMDDGTFDVYRFPFVDNAIEFEKAVANAIQTVKNGNSNKGFGDVDNNVYYFSCVPWLDYTDISNPIPDDIKNATIPRISWGKYVNENGRWKISLNLTASHAFVDGKHIADVFAYLEKSIENCEKILTGDSNE